MAEQIKIGLVADLHHALIHNGMQRLNQFLEAARKADVDFIMELGDFHILAYDDQTESGKHARFTDRQIYNKFAFLRRFNSFEKPAYHTLGNHDCDYYTYTETLKLYGMENNYYSFHKKGWHFIVLDGNYFMDDDGNYVHYSKGQYFKQRGKLPYISPDQLEWLDKELSETNEPVIIFSHQPLFNYQACIRNVDAFQAVLKKAKDNGKNIRMCVNGHIHIDDLDEIDGTMYYNVNSMSLGTWLGKAYATQRFSDQTERNNPYLQYVEPYTKALYSIVTMDDEGFHVDGIKGGFVHPSAMELGVANPADSIKKRVPCVRERDVKWPK